MSFIVQSYICPPLQCPSERSRTCVTNDVRELNNSLKHQFKRLGPRVFISRCCCCNLAFDIDCCTVSRYLLGILLLQDMFSVFHKLQASREFSLFIHHYAACDLARLYCERHQSCVHSQFKSISDLQVLAMCAYLHAPETCSLFPVGLRLVPC